ncbi:fatty-acid amide hydrolase 2 [Parasteatoda tepidariorum]|uniref:fatty-acid amide hydrolase 2 n=1 Tax=Parasteatoda tepidariorum TaxID=114398 RepID=UPI0039BC669E
MFDKIFKSIRFWAKKLVFSLLSALSHIMLMFIYWGKGKTVPPVTNDLLLMSATRVAEKIRNGLLKSEDVVLAYIERIIEVETDINAVAEYRFQEAIKEAKEIDAHIKSGKYTREQLKEEKPLLGVPFTVKVLLNVKGVPNTGGSLMYKDSPSATTDAPTVALMKFAGAIVLATSNSAELGLGFDTINLLYGKTCNPYDTNRTAGGSSGGESALIGAAASVMGLGNDLFGSVRLPAHFTGIYSHKPSRGLVPNGGCIINPTEETSKFLETGPMCRYVEDLVPIMKILATNSTEKREIERKIDLKKLKIFYQVNIDDPTLMRVDKEIVTAIKTAIDHFFTEHGVAADEVNVKLLKLTSTISIPLLFSDVPNIIQYVSQGKINSINGILELVKFAFGKTKISLGTIIASGFEKYLSDRDKIHLHKNLLQRLEEDFENILDENSVFFCPTLPFSAPRHYAMVTNVLNTAYVGVFNLLGFPATQCPLGLNHAGLPHGMQIIARKNNDALTLACAKELDKVFGGWIPPS